MSDPDNTFRSKVGHRPIFFVPDTGAPGGSASLVAPDGSAVEVLDEPVLSLRTNPDGTPHISRFGPRVGFRVPYVFEIEGEYSFVITQDGQATTYTVVVEAADAVQKGITR